MAESIWDGWRQLTGKTCIGQLLIAVISSILTAVVAHAEAPSPIVISVDTKSAGPSPLNAWLAKPKAGGKRPAIVAMHGCAGVTGPRGSLLPIYRDWADRLTGEGYAVLFVDSFGSRRIGPQCAVKERQIIPRDRAADAIAAATWLGQQPDIDASRLGLIGWSHGGSTTLWAVDSQGAKPAADFKVAIAFYPGCAVQARQQTWDTRMPLTILIGAADDWTPPEPCRALGQRTNVRYFEYPGAYHAFDNPNLPVRVRTGLTYTAKGDGVAHVGTDPAARAAAIHEVVTTLREALTP